MPSFKTSEGLLGFSGKPGESKHQLKPVALDNLASHTIVQLATGDDHFLALTSDGHVFACGNGEQHQLGRKIIARVSCSHSPQNAAQLPLTSRS